MSEVFLCCIYIRRGLQRALDISRRRGPLDEARLCGFNIQV